MLTYATVPVSVIIPCFRCAATIRRAVLSVIAQTQKPEEIILVDDASGDDTLGLLRQLEQQYPALIKIVALTVNKGAACARNTGWNLAAQPYIAFLDADDSWHPDKLRIQFEFMRNHRNVVLCGHQCDWLRDNIFPPISLTNLDTIEISAVSLLFKNAFSTPTVMLKRDIPFRFQEGKRHAEDLLLWQTIAFSGLQIVRMESLLAYTHKPLYGAEGLSAELGKMEMGELNNFITLYQLGKINFVLTAVAIIFSLVKFVKRFFLIKLKPLICPGSRSPR
ncbi:MAG: glycosyltransferase family 2 protein [Methylomonas sp.]|jgi:glycosyltransferase involved in cell wall biosynthesis